MSSPHQEGLHVDGWEFGSSAVRRSLTCWQVSSPLLHYSSPPLIANTVWHMHPHTHKHLPLALTHLNHKTMSHAHVHLWWRQKSGWPHDRHGANHADWRRLDQSRSWWAVRWHVQPKSIRITQRVHGDDSQRSTWNRPNLTSLKKILSHGSKLCMQMCHRFEKGYVDLAVRWLRVRRK